MKIKLSPRILCSLVVGCLGLYGVPAAAFDRCSPELLDKLPASKRAMIEKKCSDKAGKPAYTISNAKTVAKEKRPKDGYKGGDKDELIAMVKEAWEAKYPDDKIMGIHIPSAKWKTTKSKKWNSATNEFQYNDTSTISASVVVKTDDKTATIFPAFVNRHNDDNSMNVGVATKDNKYVIKQMLVANY